MRDANCQTCTDAASGQSLDDSSEGHIYLFFSQRGTKVFHFLVEASNPSTARDKLEKQFDGVENAKCLGTPKGVMDAHKPEVVMV